MNYYDELGVSRDATERELRQAYRVLVRLLHPDTQTGDDLRLAAERQLSRLNEMLRVLTNVDARRAYDLSLEPGREQRQGRRYLNVLHQPMAIRTRPPAGFSAVAREAALLARFAVRYWALILIGVVVFGAITVSALLHGTNEPVAESEAAATPRPSAAPVAKKPTAREIQVPPTFPKTDEQRQPAPARGLTARHSKQTDSRTSSVEAPLPAAAATAAAPVALPELLADPGRVGDDSEAAGKVTETVAQIQPHALPPASPPRSLFSGNWLYTTDLAAPQEGEGYRALYVELLLAEKDGALTGNYRARYVVPDKAISPQVSFQLQGRASSERGARVEWSAPNGARGEAELSLGTTGIMDFRWWSTQSGGQAGLSSGTAKLIRRRTP